MESAIASFGLSAGGVAFLVLHGGSGRREFDDSYKLNERNGTLVEAEEDVTFHSLVDSKPLQPCLLGSTALLGAIMCWASACGSLLSLRCVSSCIFPVRWSESGGWLCIPEAVRIKSRKPGTYLVRLKPAMDKDNIYTVIAFF